MTSISDRLIYFSLFFSIFLFELLNSTSFIFENNSVYPTILIFILFIVVIYFYKKLKDKKRVGEFLKKDLTDLGYEIIAERPPTFKDRYENYEIKFGPYINGIPLDNFRYKAQFKRHFFVKTEKGNYFELIISIIQTWRNKIKFRIDDTTRIRN